LGQIFGGLSHPSKVSDHTPESGRHIADLISVLDIHLLIEVACCYSFGCAGHRI